MTLDKHKGAFLSSGASLQMILDKEPGRPLALGPLQMILDKHKASLLALGPLYK